MSSVCQDCGKTFPNLRKLNIHKIVHNNTEVNCNICNVICEGSKVSDKTGMPTTKRGRWEQGETRTFKNIEKHYKDWLEETEGNRKLLKNHKSCEFPPLKLPQYLDNSEVIFTFPPDPLHINLLGAGNDVHECLEKHFPNDKAPVYKRQVKASRSSNLQ